MSGQTADATRQRFGGRLLMIGYGSIGRCLLPLILRHIDIPAGNITVIEKDESRGVFEAAHGGSGVGYVCRTIDRDNLEVILDRYLSPGGIVINVSVEIESIDIIGWCQKNGVLYVDSSVEHWAGEYVDEHCPILDRTLYSTHQMIRDENEDCWSPDGPTAIVGHGANPGLVSHFAKAALLRVAGGMGLDTAAPRTRAGWAELCRATGTRVIHISERDTQISRVPRRPGEFVNTWSVEGFWAEATGPAEVGWGTHEQWTPEGAIPHRYGPCNSIYFSRASAAMLMRSWVPLGGPIIGYCVQHSEVVTLSDYLTVWDEGDPVYRPTVAYVYQPCDAAVASIHELRQREWRLQPNHRIMNDDIVSGVDAVGVLVMGHGHPAYWYGSQLAIDEARALVPGQNATTLQVAAGVLAAAVYAMRHPNEGFREPEMLDHEEILELARPYLGRLEGVQSGWTPLRDRSPLFRSWEMRDADRDDLWQFRNFLVR